VDHLFAIGREEMEQLFLMDRVILLKVSLPSTVIQVHMLRLLLFWTGEPLHGDQTRRNVEEVQETVGRGSRDRGPAATQRDGRLINISQLGF